MNIILIVADTFRQDHLGCYGNEKIITPNLDKFSEDCTKFNNTYANSFPTMPCRADLFTGKNTFTYQGWNPITGEDVVLAELLSEAGYTTLAAVDTPFHIRNGYGYDRGFKDYVFTQGQLSGLDGGRVKSDWTKEEDRFAPVTISKAEKLLEYYYQDKFFMYIDMWDPHEPWDAPEYYTKLYRPEYDGEDHINPIYGDWKGKVSKHDIDLCHDMYCGEVTMVDRWIGMLIDKVKRLGIWEDTAILFTSDHGYCFGEHNLLGKARITGVERTKWSKFYDAEWFKEYRKKNREGESQWIRSPIYEEIGRVPLLAYVPGAKSAENDALVNLCDIMPSILDLAGVDIPDFVEGNSILPLINKEADSIRDIAISSYPLYKAGEPCRIVDGSMRPVRDILPITVTSKDWSMFYTDNDTPVELYDLRKDPGQLNNVYEDNKGVAKELHAKLIKQLEESNTDPDFIATRNKLPE